MSGKGLSGKCNIDQNVKLIVEGLDNLFQMAALLACVVCSSHSVFEDGGSERYLPSME